MTFNSPIYFVEAVLLFIAGLSLVNFFIKRRKMAAESSYKLIDDLEKKYIHRDRNIVFIDLVY